MRNESSLSHKIISFFVDKDTALRFDIIRRDLIEALLLPWADTKPPPDYQEYWCDWLRQNMGDPRLIILSAPILFRAAIH